MKIFSPTCLATPGRLAALLGLWIAAAGLAPAAPSLRDVLSPAEFARAGLDKLTPAELEFLSDRLLGPAAPVPAAPPAAGGKAPERLTGAAAFGREEQVQAEAEKARGVPREIQSRIAGAFAGWSGGTVFTLENGQVWRQVEPGVFSVLLDQPKITVRKGAFGAFYLGVEGYGSRIKVVRVK